MQAFSPHAAGMPSFMEMVSTYANAANSRMGMRRLNLAAQSQAFEQQQAEENQTFDQGLRAAKEQRDQALFAELQQQRAVSAVRAAKEFEWASAENLMKLEDQRLKLDALKRRAVADAAYSDARMNGRDSALGGQVVKRGSGRGRLSNKTGQNATADSWGDNVLGLKAFLGFVEEKNTEMAGSLDETIVRLDRPSPALPAPTVRPSPALPAPTVRPSPALPAPTTGRN